MAVVCRITVAEVEKIFETDMETDAIQRCIVSANVLVTNVVQTKGVLSSDELREVELWLAAHFCAIKDPVALRVKVGDAEAWFMPPASVTTAWGKGFLMTSYGSQAVSMDSTGSLANLGKQRASFRVAPRENSTDFNRGLD